MILHLPIDHFVILTRDLDAARDAFRAAGFSATPVSRHSEAMGTANTCIMLEEDRYIEVLGIVADTPANQSWRALLEDGTGLRGVALASGDIEATGAMLAAMGIDAEDPRHFARMTPDGDLRFSVIRLPRAMTPGVQCIVCLHHTPHLLWTPHAMRHDNGATHILAARMPGIAALGDLAADGGLPVEDGADGAIEIAMPRPATPAALDAISRETGVRILPRRPA